MPDNAIFDLSFVIPAFNEEKNLVPLINRINKVMSVVNKTYELIIVDNGSEKKTQEWIEKNSDRCIINNTNKGFARGFNAGIYE